MTALPPLPAPDADTQPYWDAAADQRLVVPRCASCGRWIWLPRPLCPACHAPDPHWTQVAGAGHLLSWAVIHPPVLPVWAGEVPFTVALVELDEGIRMVGRVSGGSSAAPVIGYRVMLAWRSEGGRWLPAWSIAP